MLLLSLRRSLIACVLCIPTLAVANGPLLTIEVKSSQQGLVVKWAHWITLALGLPGSSSATRPVSEGGQYRSAGLLKAGQSSLILNKGAAPYALSAELAGLPMQQRFGGVTETVPPRPDLALKERRYPALQVWTASEPGLKVVPRQPVVQWPTNVGSDRQPSLYPMGSKQLAATLADESGLLAPDTRQLSHGAASWHATAY